jgi:hypothetical protein
MHANVPHRRQWWRLSRGKSRKHERKDIGQRLCEGTLAQRRKDTRTNYLSNSVNGRRHVKHTAEALSGTHSIVPNFLNKKKEEDKEIRETRPPQQPVPTL